MQVLSYCESGCSWGTEECACGCRRCQATEHAEVEGESTDSAESTVKAKSLSKLTI